MDNLPYLAFVLIYPDGYIDKMEIDNRTSHVEYFKELRTTSPRFEKICGKCNYDIGIHTEFDLALVKAGVIALYNFNLKDISLNHDFVSSNMLSSFKNFIPNKLGSMDQLEQLKFFHSGYPEQYLKYFKGPKDVVINCVYFDELNYDDITIFINQEEDRLLELEKDRKKEFK